jgi:dTDP-4-amino-4,6-dideoxygalactose transaminase
VHFIPIPMHPFFAAYADRPENDCPGAMALYPRMVSLPLYPSMTEEQVEYTARTVKAVLQRARKGRPVTLTAGGGC